MCTLEQNSTYLSNDVSLFLTQQVVCSNREVNKVHKRISKCGKVRGDIKETLWLISNSRHLEVKTIVRDFFFKVTPYPPRKSWYLWQGWLKLVEMKVQAKYLEIFLQPQIWSKLRNIPVIFFSVRALRFQCNLPMIFMHCGAVPHQTIQFSTKRGST